MLCAEEETQPCFRYTDAGMLRTVFRIYMSVNKKELSCKDGSFRVFCVIHYLLLSGGALWLYINRPICTFEGAVVKNY